MPTLATTRLHRAGRVVAATTAAGGALGAAALSYGWKIERNAFALRELRLPLLPAGARPLRLLHVSDLHLDPSRHRLVAWVRDLDRLEPDLVVATGDFLAGVDCIPTVLTALAPLLSRPGMFVPGNADYFAAAPKSPTRYVTRRPKHGTPLPWPELSAGLRAGGWTDLTHVRTRVTIAGTVVDARGVDDPYLRKDRYQRVSGAPDPAADLSLALLHAPEPRLLDLMTADGISLLLAGHTHGGQVRIPGYGALVTNCGIDRRRARGLHTYDAYGQRSWLHVSAGLGTSPYVPVRFCCRPEATLLTIGPREPERRRRGRR